MSGAGGAHGHGDDAHAHDHSHPHDHDHTHDHPAVTPTVLLAVGGEAAGWVDPAGRAVRVGRELLRACAAADPSPSRPVVVVPMTLGREPTLVADCARTLRDGRAEPGSVALAPPLGDATMAIARLRAVLRRHPEAEAALVVAPAIDPFADAELYRVARLARQYGRPALVEVAFDGGVEPDPDLAEGLRRCAALGGPRPVLVPAGLGPAPVTGQDLPGEGTSLFSAAALKSVVATRVAAAVHSLAHGDDGIAAGVDAEDGHGYAHSHVAEDGTVYTHSH